MAQSLPAGSILKGTNYTYRIDCKLGQGSFGITYLAEVIDNSGNVTQLVCIKEFFMSDINGREGTTVTAGSEDGLFGSYRKKFLREALHLATIKDDNIVKIIEHFEANKTVYYSMSYISGGSLDDIIKTNGKLSEKQSFYIAKKVAKALKSMHSKGMLHLDLKPGNIMMLGGEEPVLIDFGLSKNFNSEGEPESSTKIGGGTPGYAPLEQGNYKPEDGIPATMDIYALGATIYKMLTGERAPIASEIFNEGFPSGYLYQSGITGEAIEIIKKSMSPSKKERYQSMEDFISAIEEVESRFSDEIAKPIGNIIAEVVATSEVNSQPKASNGITTPTAIQSGYKNDVNNSKSTISGISNNKTSNTTPKKRKKAGSFILYLIIGIIIGLILMFAFLIILGSNMESSDGVVSDSTSVVQTTPMPQEEEVSQITTVAENNEEVAKNSNPDNRLILTGDMAGFPIKLDLVRDNGNVTGTYYNIKYNVKFKVSGYCTATSMNLTMTHGSSSWTMELFLNDSGYHGTAVSESSGKLLEVNLRESNS
ncbi:MAG: serine/threonine protein kinase [Prevotella sp.]|nr:serine/threonine protein kinase [Bacteroides sp.]MCM1366432.1 serine/threonine protein kinase [Prevotella sp.]